MILIDINYYIHKLSKTMQGIVNFIKIFAKLPINALITFSFFFSPSFRSFINQYARNTAVASTDLEQYIRDDFTISLRHIRWVRNLSFWYIEFKMKIF